ncbi:hypothetical protein K4A83_02915 [Spirulina subsalsa FACHB-351]|uniref:Uncharacterized protein n=1 Tax=Spirulina subsalsa FACHB-351 TaxID=234711 RepID=A0ABT3L148_9CYAN|nr:hypothetical protein [Spirulina subsalsa]MCW6035224.1 hypothetical protein [Spirulina subsalsa FACHB-351]
MSISLLIDEIASTLDQHKNALRIRKLLFCACHQRWEGDRKVLEQLDLARLLQEFYSNNLTLDQCTESLFHIVNHLNRQGEYTKVANFIIAELEKLYEIIAESTEFFPPLEVTEFTPINSYQISLSKIAAQLDQHPEVLRLRKLIYCACYNKWENNPHVLMGFNLTEELLTLREQNQSLDDLSLTLQVIVKSLNRKATYAKISNVLLSQMGLLYPQSTQEEKTVLRVAPQSLPSPVKPPPAYEIEEVTSPLNHGSVSYDSLALDLWAEPPLEETGLIEPSAIQDSIPTPAPPPKSATYDPFKVRLEVMKYANPLRAKILVYSVLHPTFDGSSADWSNLRSQTLNYLLFELYNQYSEYSELANQLYTTLSHLDYPEENAQVAEAILQAIKPYYS